MIAPRKYGLKRTSIFSERWKGRPRGTRDALAITVPSADGIDGSGTEGTHAIWTDSDTLGDSRVTETDTYGHVEVLSEGGDTLPLAYFGGDETEALPSTNDILVAVSGEEGNAVTGISPGDGHAGLFRLTAVSSDASAAVKIEVAGNQAALDLESRVKPSREIVSGATAIKPTTEIVFFNGSLGPYTLQLPAAADYQYSKIEFQNTANAANTITFARKTGTTDTINGGGAVGATSVTMAIAFGAIRFRCDGAKWYRV